MYGNLKYCGDRTVSTPTVERGSPGTSEVENVYLCDRRLTEEDVIRPTEEE